MTILAHERLDRQLAPVNARGYFVGGATAEDLLMGAAVLAVVDERGETPYWCEAILDKGRLLGVRLTKFGSAERYDIDLVALTGCSCPDHVYRPWRMGGCKHMVALRQALITMANDLE